MQNEKNRKFTNFARVGVDEVFLKKKKYFEFDQNFYFTITATKSVCSLSHRFLRGPHHALPESRLKINITVHKYILRLDLCPGKVWEFSIFFILHTSRRNFWIAALNMYF